MTGTYWYDKETLTQSPTRPLSDQARHRATRHRATRHVASMAKDAEDAAQLLDMLGLDPAEGKATKEAA